MNKAENIYIKCLTLNASRIGAYNNQRTEEAECNKVTPISGANENSTVQIPTNRNGD